jgi:hypothetical protein
LIPRSFPLLSEPGRLEYLEYWKIGAPGDTGDFRV